VNFRQKPEPVEIGRLVQKISRWNPVKAAPDEEFKYIDLSSVDKDQKAITSTTTHLGVNAPSRAQQLVKAGDVLVSTVRPNLNGVAQVPELLDDATASTGYCVLRPNSKLLDARYLLHWVKTQSFVDSMVKVATGANYPAVSDKDVKASTIPLSPLEQQKRIAAILDKADELRAKRRRAIAKLDELLTSVFLELFGDPVANPKSWPRVPFGELLEAIESGWSPTCEDRVAEKDEWGVLKLGAVTYCVYDDSANKALPSALEPRPGIEVKQGDLLFSRKNTYDLVAACAYVVETRPKLMLPDLIFRFKLKQDSPISPGYLWALLTHEGKRKTVQALAGGAAGSMPNISKTKLYSVEIELPPVDAQERYEKAFSRIWKLKKQLSANVQKLDALFTSLQARAFSGDLTPDAQGEVERAEVGTVQEALF
jgi:type I restriction enzyme S subunit